MDDALLALQTVADAIIVSNHGGRQLDGAPATIDMLGAIVDAVGHKIEVFFDSGIRTGIDIMKAMALGAKGTMVGRAYIYGLGAAGEAGVTRALEILKSELDVTRACAAESDITKVGRHNLMLPTPPFTIPAPSRALQNRVQPDGSIVAVPDRGLMMGNRGGSFHRDDKTLASAAGPASTGLLRLHYKGMTHEAMGRAIPALFFLDEGPALAAGTGPVFSAAGRMP